MLDEKSVICSIKCVLCPRAETVSWMSFNHFFSTLEYQEYV